MFASITRELSRLVVLAMVMLSAHALAFEAGNGYDELPTPVPVMSDGRIHIEEAFWYGCPHCFHLEDTIEPWSAKLPEDVEFKQVPALFGKAWVSHAQLYYTLEALNLLDKAHTPVFNAIHRDKKQLLGQDAQRKFLIQTGFLQASAKAAPEVEEEEGGFFGFLSGLFGSEEKESVKAETKTATATVGGKLTGDDFDKAYNSFSVKSRMQQADKRIRSFGISGVPALIVQGKYVVTASTANGQQNIPAVVDFLIEKERAALAK